MDLHATNLGCQECSSAGSSPLRWLGGQVFKSCRGAEFYLSLSLSLIPNHYEPTLLFRTGICQQGADVAAGPNRIFYGQTGTVVQLHSVHPRAHTEPADSATEAVSTYRRTGCTLSSATVTAPACDQSANCTLSGLTAGSFPGLLVQQLLHFGFKQVLLGSAHVSTATSWESQRKIIRKQALRNKLLSGGLASTTVPRIFRVPFAVRFPRPTAMLRRASARSFFRGGRAFMSSWITGP